MSSILTATEIAALTTDLNNAFDTFTRDIVVWKEPIRQPITPLASSDNNFGFGNAPVEQEYSFTPVSGVFSANVRYAGLKHVGEAKMLPDTNTFIPIGEVKIKVTPECYAYIENDGKTDKISFDNRDFTFVGKPEARPFMGTLYYVYQLVPKV